MHGLFVLAVLIALAHAETLSPGALTPTPTFEECETTFQQALTLAQASGTTDDECKAFLALSACLRAGIRPSINVKGSHASIELVKESINRAVSRQTSCNLAGLHLYPLDEEPEKIKEHKVKGRSIMTAFESAQRIKDLLDIVENSKGNLIDYITAQLQVITQYTAATNVAVGDLFAAAITGLNGRLSAASSTAAVAVSLQPTIAASVSSAQATTSNQLSAETGARGTAKSNIDSTSASLSISISTLTSAAVADRSTIRARGVTSAPSTAVSTMVAAATSDEATRNTAETAARAAAISTARSAQLASVSTAVTSEFARLNTSCSTATVALGSGYKAPVQTGSNDYTSCSTPGLLYYSTDAAAFFLCVGGTFTPLIMDWTFTQFLTSKITTREQASIFMNQLGSMSQWTMCYSGSTHGYSGSTMKSLCNNLGPNTLTMVKDTNGRFFGGFNDLAWTNGYCWRSAPGAWLYRFTPDAGELEQIYPMMNVNNAIYDCSSYCPTWGGGHDLYLPNSCNAAYFGSYTYSNQVIGYPQSYNYVNWQSVSSSVNVADIEVWYRNN